MARTPARRQCPRCGHWNPGQANACHLCQSGLVRRRWRMTAKRIRYVHVLAMRQKGLDREAYELNLGAVGVSSCKELRRRAYYELLGRLRRLPDVPGWGRGV